MKKYLLDTNAFFELLSYLSGKTVRKDGYDFADIRQGECYISKITELEILSVIGKYGRGVPSQWQTCRRQISEEGEKCGKRYFFEGTRPWNKKLCAAMKKLVKEMIDGFSGCIDRINSYYLFYRRKSNICSYFGQSFTSGYESRRNRIYCSWSIWVKYKSWLEYILLWQWCNIHSAYFVTII